MTLKSNWVARLVIHQKDKHNWRLRNMTKHPIDPNWETGTYCKCHKDLRQNMKNGKWIIDAVIVPPHKYPCTRSAFKIKSKKDEILEYDGFWFNDGALFEITPKIVSTIKRKMYRTRHGKNLSNEDLKKLFQEFMKHSFHYYTKGQKPKSITYEDWKEMKKAARESMSKHHNCELG